MRDRFGKPPRPPRSIAIHDQGPESNVDIITWLIWGIVLAASVIWNDHDIPPALGFVLLGVFMGTYGKRCVFASTSILHDTAARWWQDEELERACGKELVQAAKLLARSRSEDKGPDIKSILNSQNQRRRSRQHLFNAVFGTPLLMGCWWGVAIGGLCSAIILPLEFSIRVSVGIVIGILTGGLIVACLWAAIIAFGWPCGSIPSWTFKQRFLLLVSPVLNIAILAKTAVSWIRRFLWHRARSNRFE